MRQKSAHNLFFRLRHRETIVAKPCTEINYVRRFSEVVTPSCVVRNVKLADYHVCRFTPSGRYLVCFSALQHELLLFAFTGLQFSCAGDGVGQPLPLPDNAAAFGSHFQLLWRRHLVAAPHMLCKDAFLALHKETILVVAAQSPPSSGRGSPPGGGLAALPLVATTTIFLVRASNGEVTDTLALSADFVHLSHNAGLAACGDRLAVLGLRSQTIHLLQVLPDGRFSPLAQLGPHLAPDDELVLAQAAADEARWRAAQPQAARQMDMRARQLEAAAGSAAAASPARGGPPSMRHSASHAIVRAGSVGGGVFGGGVFGGTGLSAARGAQLQAISGMERPNNAVLGQLLHAPNSMASSSEAEASAARERAGGSGMITGLRQRILAYLCHALRHPLAGRLLEAGGDGGSSGGGGGGVAGGVEAQRSHSAAIDGGGGGGGHAESAAGQRPPRDRFILHFDSFNSLVVWKAQFLDEGHLLLALGPPDASALRHAESQQQAAFLGVFDLAAGRVCAVLPNSSPALLETYLHHAGHFSAPAVTCAWERFLTPGGAPAHARAAVDRQMAHQYWTPQQVTRRVLAAIPPTSQVLSASPFLDACLFQYDEKLISPVIRPRALAEVPLKFSSRGRRETVRLKISGSVFESPAPSARPQKQLVTWHFHPVLPFVLGVLQTSNAAPQAVIYHRL